MNRACDERPIGLDKIYRKKMFFFEILICLKKRFALHFKKKHANLNEVQNTNQKKIVVLFII